MTCDTYHGSNTLLLGQLQTAVRTAPGAAHAVALRFSDVSLNRGQQLQEDPTIQNTVLKQKPDEIDETPSGTLTSVACLNQLYFWLTFLFGAPVTTGASAPYTHTFTLTNSCRPTALLELEMLLTGNNRFRRFLGMYANGLSWDFLADQQNFSLELLMGGQVRPHPTAAWDAAPTKWPKQVARAAAGLVYDVDGASTLGQITGATFDYKNNSDGVKLADGLAGYGDYLQGEPSIGGNLRALFKPGEILDFAESQTSKKLVLETASVDGSCTCVITLPNVFFRETTMQVNTKKGLMVEVPYEAHHVDGADPVTVVLVNSVSGMPS